MTKTDTMDMGRIQSKSNGNKRSLFIGKTCTIIIGNLRTIVSLLLIVALLLGNGGTYAYAADGTTEGDTATMLLASMGVLSADSTGSYNLSGTVTRAEFAKMIVMASEYKDLVQTTSYSSPYKDVSAKHWAAPYVRIAVSKGLMTGYSNGTFRPDSTITLEQGVNSVLLLLGYTQSDFVGAFPYAQMNMFSNNGLSENISGGIGTYMTRGDAANLIYNMMGAVIKDGSKTYAEKLGYTLNSSGEVNYAEIISDNMNGPYTVKSSYWADELGMPSTGLTIYKNGSLVTADDVELYDVLYYSQSKGTVWVYDDKVTGVYESASPSQNAVTSVTVSGTEYTLESGQAFAALSSTGSLKIGSAVTLLLGKDGGVADAVSSTVVNEPAVVYVTGTGTKTYETSNGKEYTSFYFKGIKPNGSEIEYTTTQDWITPGDMLKLNFDSTGKMSVGSARIGSNISGKVDADLYTIGSVTIASNARIIDTSLGNYAPVSMARLSGITFSSDDVLYYEASGGKVTTLILNDVTGDTAEYGLIISAKLADSSGSYEYILGDGVTTTLKSSGAVYHIEGGGAKFYGKSGSIDSIKALSNLTTKVKAFNASQISVNDSVGTYPLSADVAVFTKVSGVYKLVDVNDAIKAFQAKQMVTFYYDKVPKEGGCVRVIVF